MKKTITFLIAMSFFFFHYTAIEAEDQLILFHSNTCGHCQDVIDAIDEYELNEILDIEMIEASEERFEEVFATSLEECDVDTTKAGYPTLYHNGDCSVGSDNAINTLLELAGIETVLGEETEETEPEGETEETEQEEEVRTLDEITETESEREPRPFWQILAMFVGPAILIGIAYVMIKKLNL